MKDFKGQRKGSQGEKKQLLFYITYNFPASKSRSPNILTLPFMPRANLYKCKRFFHLHTGNAGLSELILGC